MALIEMAMENRMSLDMLDDYIEAHVHGLVRIADDVEAIVLDPCYKGTPVETAAHRLPCAVEWHGGFRLSTDRLDDCERYRGKVAADAIYSMSYQDAVTPLEIGSARLADLDYQVAKWVWHCVACFGLG